ncbi:GNAT family N-acetyltransferase [Nocardiopsis sp. MG754419]|uniref:GNAT family N-acetyltransferase n=1 Tax=Nocardiopsis sp. MG754419 TaxID=2259865 RepID=UPI001BAAE292|nr:GNAT family N-acetyltransferase [Nocardiopsis sp. MG754419]MBR8744313.1 N-acetyltransferase [Nocardiopsis sp. MG754419]
MGERQKCLFSDRLVLEPLAERHADAVVDLFADPAMSSLLGTDLSAPTLARRMVDDRLAYDGPPEPGHWAVLLDGDLVGLAHLRPSGELPDGLPEIGWYLAARHGGRGLATEAARALLRHGLDDLGLHSVWALVHVDNAPSLRLARRLGLLVVGEGHHDNGPHRVHVGLPGPV